MLLHLDDAAESLSNWERSLQKTFKRLQHFQSCQIFVIFSLCDGGMLRLTVAHLCTIYRVTSWFAQGVFADVGSMAVETKFLPALYQAEVLEIKSTDLSWLNHGSKFRELYTFWHTLVDV